MSDKEHTLKYFCSICGTPTEPIDTNGETCYCDNKDCPINGVHLESNFFRVRELIENEKRLVRENNALRELAKEFFQRAPGCKCELIELSNSGLEMVINDRLKEALESTLDK